ncbi:MAG TPA: right-handed parallel beta-helix repeat-containing protein [Acidimicrobiales bacterium]
MTRAPRARWLLAMVAAVSLLAVACGSSKDQASSATTAPAGSPSGNVIKVPADKPTIQAAVDAAQQGDLILISPGVYKEAVNVTTDYLDLRGTDRNTVILDGEFTRENGVRVLGANGVAVENMTARNYTGNGFFWTGVQGYRGSYLTSFRTGNYGIYAFDATKGQLDHSYASGSPDAGVYIGGCQPCDAVISDLTSEYNGLGYSGTNSGGNLVIVNSIFRHNRAGLVPNSGSYEPCYPERDTTIVGNVVYDNNQADSPAIDVALLAMGNGILVAGGRQNDIERNLVYDHERTGIGLVPFPENDANDHVPTAEQMKRTCAEQKKDPVPNPKSAGTVLWPAADNKVIGNSVSGSGLADLGFGDLSGQGPAELGNCFGDNTFTTSSPNNIQTLAPCTGTGTGDPKAGALDLVALIASKRPPAGDYKVTPEPKAQPNMPDAESAPARPAIDVPMAVDLAAIKLPAKPTDG